MPEADIKPFFPAASVVAGKRILHTLSGLGNNKAITAFIAVICFLMAANLNASVQLGDAAGKQALDDFGSGMSSSRSGPVPPPKWW